MYKIIASFCLLFFSANLLMAQQQKIEEKTFAWDAGRSAKLNLKFASNIKVSSWNKSELYLKTIITYEKEAHLKIHKMEVQEMGRQLIITTDYAKNFFRNKRHTCWSCDEEDQNEYGDCTCFKLEFEIMMPKGADLALETIAGNIEIKDIAGPVKAKSISGFIDLGLEPSLASNLYFKSVTGEIYTDFDVDLDKNSSAFSKRLTTALNGGGAAIDLETVSGDIFFRKK
ncbi:MAG: DUF4097 domain-containing protein [Saprospiraceae bacterium]|nr:DUF4097 domain-containing protein [Saprospiraceae bacterium]